MRTGERGFFEMNVTKIGFSEINVDQERFPQISSAQIKPPSVIYLTLPVPLTAAPNGQNSCYVRRCPLEPFQANSTQPKFLRAALGPTRLFPEGFCAAPKSVRDCCVLHAVADEAGQELHDCPIIVRAFVRESL